jgi:pimeloyl-ACP methyl ester carboxylesterase
MREIELSSGTIAYEDSEGDGPVLVLLHGLLMDASLWRDVTADLAVDHRCIAPTLPLGAHSHPASGSAELSVPSVAGLVRELLDRLELEDVTLVGNDTGGALVQLIAGVECPRVGRIVLASCDAFDNFPPGVTGRALVLAGKLPPRLFGLFMQQMRLKPLRRLPIAFGWLTKRGDDAAARWVKPILTDPAIRRDAVRLLRSIAARPALLVEASRALAGFRKPALVVWAAGDRVMPPEHGRRLAQLLPEGEYVEVEDSYTLIPLDRPTQLAHLIREFVRVPAADLERAASGDPA